MKILVTGGAGFIGSNFCRHIARIHPDWQIAVLDKITLTGGTTYDFLNKQLIDAHGSLRYDVQCCGLTVNYTHFDYNTVQDTRFSFSIQLANIGSGTNFNNQDALGPRGVGYAGRP